MTAPATAPTPAAATAPANELAPGNESIAAREPTPLAMDAGSSAEADNSGSNAELPLKRRLRSAHGKAKPKKF